MDKKTATIHYFSKMDIGMLELILDEEKTYEHAVKDIFLKRLAIAFGKFKIAGDTELVAYAGTCFTKDCSLGCKGYCFIGNNSGLQLNLVFKEDETAYTDIYHCSQLVTELPFDEDADEVFLHIGPDERADFTAGVDYLLMRSKADTALEELTLQGEVLQAGVYIDWVKKHRELYDSIPDITYSGFYDFINVFVALADIALLLPLEPEAASAMSFYHKLHHNEAGILFWLMKYEELSVESGVFLFKDNPDLGISLNAAPEIFIDPADLGSWVVFLRTYKMHRDPMFEKYKTGPPPKRTDYLTCPPENYYSLTYHLSKRGRTGEWGDEEIS